MEEVVQNYESEEVREKDGEDAKSGHGYDGNPHEESDKENKG